jgi:fatty acid desaturase
MLVAGILFLGIDFGGSTSLRNIVFNSSLFWNGFTTWSYQLRFDTVFLLFILPLVVGLFLKSRDGMKQADSILVLIAGVILAMPLLAAIAGFNLHPYRYVPLIVFFAIGVGTLFSNKVKQAV